MKLSRPKRRALLVLHITTSVSWLGLSLGLLALSVAAATSGSPDVAEASYRSMKLFADWLLIPVALLTLVSGVVLSVGTPWGLFLYRWVSVKFWLTLLTTGLTIFSLRPGINSAASQAIAGDPPTDAVNLVVPPAVSLTAYLFMTVVSVVKPWGMTQRGRKARAGTGKRMDGKRVRQTA